MNYIPHWNEMQFDKVHCVSNNVACRNSDVRQLMSIIFGKNVAKRMCYQAINDESFSTSPN